MAIKDIVKGICAITRCKYDVYTKERSDELFKIKGDFAVLTGSLDKNDSIATKQINYPNGFTKENCVITSVLTRPYSTDYYIYNNKQGLTGDCNVNLKDDGVHISLYSTGSLDQQFFPYGGIDYKITLMKIN